VVRAQRQTDRKDLELNLRPLRGCLYWVSIPGERTRKKRPALVVSVDARNRLASEVLVIPASTVRRDAPTHVRLKSGQGGVPQDCVLKCEQITTLPKELLSEHALGGEVSGQLMEQVERGVLRSIGVPLD